jgi:hypothetical protein
MRAARDVGKRLIDGNPLDQRREIAEHFDRGLARPLIFLEMPADKNEPPPGIPPRTPNAFASYEAASTTPPPTPIGLPRNDGSSSCSTDA